MPEDVFINFNSLDSIEVYSDVYLNDLIADSNAEIISENYKIDTSELGITKYKILYQVNKQKYSKDFSVTTIDSEAPRIFSSINKTIELNDSKNICEFAMYGDNYDKVPKCVIEGTYDISKVGKYDLKYIVSDNSNNESTFNFTLNVVNKIASQPSSSSQIKFSDVIEKHKSDNTEFGIDISKWQTNVDYNKVRDAGATFVMIRIGVQKAVNGMLEIDEYYLQNIKKAKEAGLKVGVYLYSIATSIEEAKDHALWVIDTLKGEQLDFPIVFDWESWSIWNYLKLSFYDINAIADAFMNTIKANGYEPMLYSSKNYLINIWENKLNYPVWLAHYTTNTDYKGDYIMWQLTNAGRINGVNGNVDINILYK